MAQNLHTAMEATALADGLQQREQIVLCKLIFKQELTMMNPGVHEVCIMTVLVLMGSLSVVRSMQRGSSRTVSEVKGFDTDTDEGLR